jgi:phospholipid/cholesterol/gamma-HCH transport system ATP-binding protein
MAEDQKTNNGKYIEFVNVWKSFGDLAVLQEVSFDVRQGELVVVLGKSGVGKSVTLKHMMGFLKPDEGQVWVAGQEISHLTEAELALVRRRVTMVFQSGALFDSLTVGENVAYPLLERAQRGEALSDDEIDERVDKMLALVDLSEAREMLPADLSTGMKRAVAIARALTAEPEAILYDEPTTMVDPIMAHTIGDLMLKLKRHTGLTSVVVTHDMRLAQMLADRVVFLIEGRVGFFGTVQEMERSEEPLVREFLELDRVNVED